MYCSIYGVGCTVSFDGVVGRLRYQLSVGVDGLACGLVLPLLLLSSTNRISFKLKFKILAIATSLTIEYRTCTSICSSTRSVSVSISNLSLKSASILALRLDQSQTQSQHCTSTCASTRLVSNMEIVHDTCLCSQYRTTIPYLQYCTMEMIHDTVRAVRALRSGVCCAPALVPSYQYLFRVFYGELYDTVLEASIYEGRSQYLLVALAILYLQLLYNNIVRWQSVDTTFTV